MRSDLEKEREAEREEIKKYGVMASSNAYHFYVLVENVDMGTVFQ
jgi:hypothetical protein